jgi:hypothetical protein
MYTVTGYVDSLFVEDENGNWQDLPVDALDRIASASPRIQAAS